MKPQDNPNTGTENESRQSVNSGPDANTPSTSDNPAVEPTQVSPAGASVPGEQSYQSQPPVSATGTGSGNSTPEYGSGNKKKLLVGITAAVIILLGGSAAAYFGSVVPNKPENVWKKSLENTGKGYDKLVEYADKKKDTKGGKLTGDYKIDAGGMVADGTIESKYDEKTSDSKITLGASGARFELNLLTNVPANTRYPDIYAKVSGLKGLDKVFPAEAGGIGESLAAYDNQWFVIDHTIFDQMEKSAAQDTTTEIKAEDVIALAKDIGEVTKEYVLTDDPSKAVLVRKENVGKESMDGRDVYHYKVGFNKANLKAYNKAVCDKILGNKLYKTLSMGRSSEDISKECYDTKDIDSINESDTFDVYVDLKTKLIHIVRIAEKDKKDNYLDIGLLYTGGDEFPFVIRGQTKDGAGEGKGELKVTLNTKTDKYAITANVDGKSDGAPFKFTLNANGEPGNDKVEFRKPEGAKSLLEVYGALLGGALGGVSPAGPAGPVPDQQLINRCISAPENALPPECKALFGEE